MAQLAGGGRLSRLPRRVGDVAGADARGVPNGRRRPLDRAGRTLRVAGANVQTTLRLATGYSPIAYVQHVRVEEAKRRLERTSEPVDAISYAVGYEDPAAFRRLFKRITGVTPGAYRRKLQLPAFARSAERRRGGR